MMVPWNSQVSCSTMPKDSRELMPVEVTDIVSVQLESHRC